ncbi:MAG: hypothetical protein ACOYNL_06155 [Rickettsiales bacterium]
MKRITFSVVGLVVAASQSARASSLPQMDPTWYGNQLLWLAISFGVLYAMVSLFIAPSIKAVLSTRENAIDEAIREAERAKSAAESTRSDSSDTSQGARIKAAEIMAKAQAENSADATDAIQKLDNDLARRADQAAAVLADAVKKASSGIEASVQSLAEAMTAQLMSNNAAPEASEPKLKLAKR